MITINMTWHCALMFTIQFVIIARIIYIYCTDKFTGMFGGFRSFFGTIFYVAISLAMWLIYGGIYWW